MDIIDIMLAKAMTPQGKTEAYAAKANRAASQAAQAQRDAAAAIATVNDALDDITLAQSEAADLLAAAQEALTTAESVTINTLDIEDVQDEIDKLRVNTNTITGTSANTLQVITTYPNSTINTQNITKLYKQTGANEDGTMTQKAITDALATISNNSGSTTIITDLGSENAGKVVVIGPDGAIVSGTITEEALIEALLINGGYTARNAVGIEIDYDNKTCTRTQEAVDKTMGTDFNSYLMYGGRMRCNVDDAGNILAFYGDDNYTEDGSNGQVMVYQPKFYYQRIPLATTTNKVGKTIIRDSIMVSYTAQNGFKLHPIFKTADNEELDYVLFSAYEGGLFDVSANSYIETTAVDVDFNIDKLTSVANVKPLTGSSNLSLERAEQLANNRGAGWHIFTLAAESANQMLEVVEFGSFNGQTALGKGICNLNSSENINIAALTGATAELGNNSGVAENTIFESNGGTYTSSEVDKSAISYRGIENPWGNVWQMLNGVIISGNTASNGGIPFICTNYTYTYNRLGENYTSTGFSLPNNSGWISALGYGSREYDWVLMPAVAENANSALPIGDNGWFDQNLTGLRMVLHGGGWNFAESDGPFYYGCDKQPTDSTYKSYGARLLYIPTKNANYNANIIKWQEKVMV